ncbi:MAG: ABC transporter permease [Nanoarchaeota archaeon]|nr:ABC transporter permease [Nanoarchaeota archaeon]MBU1030470.1 ABC transporter permease [Nanoarchaeota archaeon]MBU1850677.1 ABC transporter permease [Nanoarchaeota archaeon]
MITELIAIINKNLRRLLRSKTSSLIILIGPLLLIGIIGLAFNKTGLFGIQIGVFSETKNDLVNSVLEKIDTEEFKMVMEESKQKCILGVEDGRTHLCLIFPPEINSTSNIEFHVDYSRLSLVFTLLNVISTKFNQQSSEMSMDLTKQLLEKVQETSKTLGDNANLITTLKENARILGDKLSTTVDSIENLGIDTDLSQFNVTLLRSQTEQNKVIIGDYEESVSTQIDESLVQLEKIKQMVIVAREDVRNRKKTTENLKESVDWAYEKQLCFAQQTEDLTPYLDDSEALNEKLLTLNNPTCSFLYTAQKNADESLETLETTEEQLNQLLIDIQKAKVELSEFKDESTFVFEAANTQLDTAIETFGTIETSVEGAKTQLENINSAKQTLSSDLSSANQLINENMLTFNTIEGIFSNIQNSISDMSIITPESIIRPFSTQIKPLKTKMKMLDYFFPSLIVLVVMFVSVLLASTLVMKEKETSAYFRNFITPANNFFFTLGNYLTTLLIAGVQISIVIIIAATMFKINPGANLGSLIVLVLLVITLFSFLGIIIGNLLRNEETTTLTAIILSVIMFMFSSMIIPIESMSPKIAGFARINPFVISEEVLRKAIIFNRGFFELGGSITILLIELIVLFGLTIVTFKVAKKQAEE